MTWEIGDGGLIDLPVHGSFDGAEIEITVLSDGSFSSRCLCPACFELEQVGGEALGDILKSPGVYYMKSWHVTYPSSVNGPEEYDGGLEIHRASASPDGVD